MAKASFDIPDILAKPGPIGLIFAEDVIGLESCIRHHAKLGFENLLVLKRADINLPETAKTLCTPIDLPDAFSFDVPFYINQAIQRYSNRWIFYCFNAEYLHFPFCEHRNISELINFITEEKRSSVFTYTVDLYAGDLEHAPDGFSLEDTHFDTTGYYALQRHINETAQERQIDVYGGLKWRFEEYLPWNKKRLNRIALFKSDPDLTMDTDGYFNISEYNTISCPWHHNTTLALCSFRTAKSLKTNPDSSFAIDTFLWSQSTKFLWNSQQLMDYGFIEPGQWF